MSRKRKTKKRSSIFGALIVESLAVVLFLFLFMQARAERQQESELEQSGLPVIEQLFEQTPLQDLLSMN